MRLPWLDQVRGFAVLLMVLDHVLLAIDPDGELLWTLAVRLTVTRFALPMFMVSSGWLWSHRGLPSWERLGQVFVACLLCVVPAAALGLRIPEILGLYVVAGLFLSRLVWAYPMACLVTGFLQALYVPMFPGDYQIGLVVGWLAVGVLAHRAGVWSSYRESSVRTWVGLVAKWSGRYPLAIYCGHVWALALVFRLDALSGLVSLG